MDLTEVDVKETLGGKMRVWSELVAISVELGDGLLVSVPTTVEPWESVAVMISMVTSEGPTLFVIVLTRCDSWTLGMGVASALLVDVPLVAVMLLAEV